MSDEYEPEVDQAANELAGDALPLRHIKDPRVRALAVTFLALNGGFQSFVGDQVVGTAENVYMERPEGTQYAVCGPGSIRRRRFDHRDHVFEALAVVLVGKRNVNLDEPHELLATDFVLKCGGVTWKFRSSQYRTQQRAALAAARTGSGLLAAAHVTGQAAGLLRKAASRFRDGAQGVRDKTKKLRGKSE